MGIILTLIMLVGLIASILLAIRKKKSKWSKENVKRELERKILGASFNRELRTYGTEATRGRRVIFVGTHKV